MSECFLLVNDAEISEIIYAFFPLLTPSKTLSVYFLSVGVGEQAHTMTQILTNTQVHIKFATTLTPAFTKLIYCFSATVGGKFPVLFDKRH